MLATTSSRSTTGTIKAGGMTRDIPATAFLLNPEPCTPDT
jgi:hypothetical protein